MKRIKLLIVLSLLIVTLMISSYACNNTLSINDSIVQIWEPIGSTSGEVTLLALGVVVGDGSQILTVLNYEGYNPGRLEVGVPGQQRYQASIQVIDPRTSVTLLKLENTKFTAAAIGEPDNLQPGTDVVIHGWPGSGSGSLESRVTRFPGYATAFMMDIEEEGYISRDGATVTDKKGNVIGLVGTFYDAFVYRLGGQGMTAPIVNIDDALELLSPDAVNQPWAKGPAFSLITTEDTVTGRSPSEPPPEKFNEMTAALQSLLGTMGEALLSDELPGDYRSFIRAEPKYLDGTILTALYPSLVELSNTGGDIVAQAKWVGIQWGRAEGKPNRIFYGYIDAGRAVVEGGFVLKGDITALEDSLSDITPC